jgi:hypothetical protein
MFCKVSCSLEDEQIINYIFGREEENKLHTTVYL